MARASVGASGLENPRRAVGGVGGEALEDGLPLEIVNHPHARLSLMRDRCATTERRLHGLALRALHVLQLLGTYWSREVVVQLDEQVGAGDATGAVTAYDKGFCPPCASDV